MPLDPALIASIESLRVRAGRIVEGLGIGSHASRLRGRNVEFAEHREYTPGDDPRMLDWRLHAKSDRYYVRESEAETDFAARLLVDASASMGYRSEGSAWSKFDCAATLAAALAMIVLRQRDGVGLTVFSECVTTTVPVSGRPSHRDQITTALEAITPAGTGTLIQTASAVASGTNRRGVVFLLSDLFDEPSAIESACRRLAHARQEVRVIQVVDPAEVDFPFDEPLRFTDLEDGGIRQADGAAIATAYRKEFQRHIGVVQAICRDLGFTYLLARTDAPPERILRELLSGRHGAGNS